MGAATGIGTFLTGKFSFFVMKSLSGGFTYFLFEFYANDFFGYPFTVVVGVSGRGGDVCGASGDGVFNRLFRGFAGYFFGALEIVTRVDMRFVTITGQERLIIQGARALGFDLWPLIYRGI